VGWREAAGAALGAGGAGCRVAQPLTATERITVTAASVDTETPAQRRRCAGGLRMLLQQPFSTHRSLHRGTRGDALLESLKLGER